MRTPIEAVTFDAAGTLFQLAEPVGATYAEIALLHGIQLDPDELDESFRAAWKRAPTIHQSPASGVLPSDVDLDGTERNWWRALVMDTFDEAALRQNVDLCQSPGAMDAIFDQLFFEFGLPGRWRLFPETREVLESLSSQFRMAILSNFDRRFHGIAEGLGIIGHFAAVILSGEIGAAKPDRRIFNAATDALMVPKHRVLHVGDDPKADWEGARKAGLQTYELSRPDHCLMGLLDWL